MAPQKRPALSRICFFLLFLFACVFLCSAGYLAVYSLRSRASTEAFDALSREVNALRSSSPSDSPDPTPESPADRFPGDSRGEQGILAQYAPLYARNNHMAGWLSIDGTDLSYPVMHTPELPDYYLHRDFSGSPSNWGCIYAQEECDLLTPSDNVILYGHHMKDGTMFGSLDDYACDAYRESHPFIRFDTLTEQHVYEVFAVFTTTATTGEGFAYYDFINAGSEADFDAFISSCLALSLYDTGIVPVWGDKILCLSTCEYSRPNGRFVVAAVRID